MHVNLPTHVLTTLSPDNWVGTTAPYTTSIVVEGVRDTTEALVTTPFDITVEQYHALSHAEIITGCTTTGRVILKAYGEKPTIDLPVDILLYL